MKIDPVDCSYSIVCSVTDTFKQKLNSEYIDKLPDHTLSSSELGSIILTVITSFAISNLKTISVLEDRPIEELAMKYASCVIECSKLEACDTSRMM